ncbi:Antilisterial bacteriocin subtilosin biosynthesis protein AlbA [Candidatus Brocadiaceae bacterium]|nr:Antilisterial bacteriocin subtilosin biosynthesis protein AlbA [Candidatus Brocadiaceae bacterium]
MMQLIKTLKREISYHLGLGYAPPPESVTIEVDYSCMFRCKMCQMWTKDFKTSRIGNNKILSNCAIEGIIAELCSIGVKSIYFCGGEPFLRKDFLNIVKYCKSKGLYCSTISNGYLINEDLAKQIVISGIDSIGISIDSADRELHDEIRGMKGAFDHAAEGIRLIKQQQKEYNTDFPEVFINSTISSKNFFVLSEIVDLAKSLAVRRINFNYLSIVDHSTVELTNQTMGEKIVGSHTFSDVSPDYLLQKEHIDQLEVMMENIKKRGGSEITCDLDPALLSGNKDLLLKGKFPVLRCNLPWRSAMITPVGDVVPCAMFTNYKMGNLGETTFREIWNNKRARNIRRLLSKDLPPICQKCCMVHMDTPSLWERFSYKFLKKN